MDSLDRQNRLIEGEANQNERFFMMRFFMMLPHIYYYLFVCLGDHMCTPFLFYCVGSIYCSVLDTCYVCILLYAFNFICFIVKFGQIKNIFFQL